MWLFYAPVALWVGLLALRHRGLSRSPRRIRGFLTAARSANRSSRFSDVFHQRGRFLLRLLTQARSIRAQRVCDQMTRAGWSFPIVLKPDVGQRGAGVRLVRP